MRRILTVAASIMMVSALTACGGSSGADTKAAQTPAPASEAANTAAGAAEGNGGGDYTPITMKLSTQSAETALTAQAFTEFSKRLAEATDGKVNVDVYCSAVLGNTSESLQGALWIH